MAAWSEPVRYEIADGTLRPLGPLALEQPDRLSDPTLVEHEGRFYLFANRASVGSGALYLWWSDSLEGSFRLHPASPVLVSPKGARMGGSLLRTGGRLIRFGQDFRFGYGDGLLAFEVTQLSPERYEERPLVELRFSDRRGPHTMNVSDDELLFDWYRETFSPLAGLRRLLNKLSRR